MILEIRDEVITLSGTLPRNQWSALTSAVSLRLRHHPAGVILDLGGLTLVTPAGAQTFRETASRVARSAPGAHLILAGVPPSVARVLRQGGLGSSLAVAGNVAEARVSLQALQPIDQTGAKSGTARRDDARGPVILVGLLGNGADDHAVAVACRVAATLPGSAGQPAARMHLARILTVARDRSLLAAPGDEEKAATLRLTQYAATVQATSAVAAVVPQIERTRDAGIRLSDLAADLRARVLVLALGTNASAEEVSVARYVVERAVCEVIVNRVPVSELR